MLARGSRRPKMPPEAILAEPSVGLGQFDEEVGGRYSLGLVRVLAIFILPVGGRSRGCCTIEDANAKFAVISGAQSKRKPNAIR